MTGAVLGDRYLVRRLTRTVIPRGLQKCPTGIAGLDEITAVALRTDAMRRSAASRCWP